MRGRPSVSKEADERRSSGLMARFAVEGPCIARPVGLDDRVTHDSLRLRVRIEAAPQTVFKALTDPDDLIDWFAESVEVELAEQRYQFWGRYAPQGDRPRHSLLAAEPAQVLRYSWQFDDSEPTTVELSIMAEDEGSVVTLSHIGLPVVSVG